MYTYIMLTTKGITRSRCAAASCHQLRTAPRQNVNRTPTLPCNNNTAMYGVS